MQLAALGTALREPLVAQSFFPDSSAGGILAACRGEFVSAPLSPKCQRKEKTRLAGGEDWIRTRGCVSPDDGGLLGRQRAYFVCLQETESAKPENRADCTVQDRQCETNG